jgi:hypothetical protein
MSDDTITITISRNAAEEVLYLKLLDCPPELVPKQSRYVDEAVAAFQSALGDTE